MPGRHYATGHVNKPLIAFVTIRATDPVAIPVAHCLRVNPCNSWAIIFRGISVAPAKDNFKLSQVVPVVVIKQPLIALVPIRAIRGQKISLRTSAWKALQSEAMVTGDEVLGRKRLH